MVDRLFTRTPASYPLNFAGIGITSIFRFPEQ